MSHVASVQSFWPGVFLIVAGLGKAIALRRGDASATVIDRIRPEFIPGSPVLASFAALETGLGVLLLSGLWTPGVELGAALFFAGAAVILAWALREAPGSDCGCLGAAGSAAVSRRSVARAVALAAMSAAAASSDGSWATALQRQPLLIGLLVIEAFGLAILSGDLTSRQLMERVRSAPGVTCGPGVLLSTTALAKLRRSSIWRTARPHLRQLDPTDQWREECWRFWSFPAEYEGRNVTAVFAMRFGEPGPVQAVSYVDETILETVSTAVEA